MPLGPLLVPVEGQAVAGADPELLAVAILADRVAGTAEDILARKPECHMCQMVL